jgi:3'-5' exonuclease
VKTPRFVTLDIETVADEALVSAVDGVSSRSYREQLARILAERRARTGGRSDFLPVPYHRPVAACLLEAEERDGVLRVTDLVSWTDRREPEAAFLRRTWQRLAGRTLVTFHGRGFDLPVLELRSLKHGVAAARWFREARAAGAPAHLDLLDLLSNARASPTAPLDLYAKLLGLPGKEGVAGKDVQALYAEGSLDRIAAYCMTDVVQTWLLFLRFRLLDGALTAEGYAGSARSARQDLPGFFARLTPGERAVLDGYLERCAPFFGETSLATVASKLVARAAAFPR